MVLTIKGFYDILTNMSHSHLPTVLCEQNVIF